MILRLWSAWGTVLTISFLPHPVLRLASFPFLQRFIHLELVIADRHHFNVAVTGSYHYILSQTILLSFSSLTHLILVSLDQFSRL